jgi:hypothetical protein
VAHPRRSRATRPEAPVLLSDRSEKRSRKAIGYWLLLTTALLIAASSRFYMLSSQIFMDDEWHSLRTIADDDFNCWNVLTQFDARNNTSMPLNLYGLFLYSNFGWTEWAFRVPVVLAGLLSVVAFPVLLRRVLGDRVSLVTAFLLAISPFLVFYSRFYRAYGFVVLLGFAALLLAHRWLTTGRRRWAAGYIVAGVLAVYFHLLAAVAVFSPLAAALGIVLTRRSSGSLSKRSSGMPSAQEQLVVSTGSILTTGFCLIVCLIPLCIPVFLANDSLPWVKGSLSPSSLVTTATLISGTSHLILNVVFLALWILGQAWLVKRSPVLSWIFLCTLYAYGMAVLIARPTGCNEARVLLRYAIVVVPIALTMVAFSLDCLLQLPRVRRLGPLVAGGVFVAFVVCFFAAGPLPAIYTVPNDFTNHAAFQGSYSPLTWKTSDAPPRREYPGPWLDQNQISAFYRQLRDMNDVATVIEYPYDICNFNDQLYYYQHFHKKRVLVGCYVDPAINDYTNDLSPELAQDGFDTTGVYLDGIFYYFADRSRVRFRNIVDLSDADALARSGADVVVLHKSATVMTTAPQNRTGQCRVFYRYVDVLRSRFQSQFGPPLYEDDSILCFRIRKPSE